MQRPDGRASARKSFVLMVVGTMIFFLCSVSSADVPQMINYQGKLTTASGGCLNDTVQMTFSIYPDTTGSPADWTETQNSVIVKEGIFNVLLGSVDSIPSSAFDGNIKYLGVQVESDPEMRPLKPMVSVAYAYRAGTADGGGGGWVDDGTVVRLADSTDQVGIGTSNPRPGYKLHLKDAPGVYLLFDHGRDTTWILGSSVPGNQSFYIGQQNPYGGISRLRIMTNGDTQLCPATGNVGIGTTSPDAPAHVRTTTLHTLTGGTFKVEADQPTPDVARIVVYSHRDESPTNVAAYEGHGRNANGQQVNYADIVLGMEENTADSEKGFINFRTTNGGPHNLSSRMHIDGDGNVGIGTTTPDFKLHIRTTGTNRLLKLESADAAEPRLHIYDYLGGALHLAKAEIPGYGGQIYVRNDETCLNLGANTINLRTKTPGSNTYATKVALSNDGNVGIGTTNPQGALDVNSTTGALIVPRMTTAQRNTLTPVNGMIIYNTIDNEFNFYENGAWVTK